MDDPQFPDRLQRLLDEKGMTRADLARLIWGEMTDERGYTVARNRQSVSRYISGKMKPSETTKRQMAAAMSIPYSQLCPNDDPTNRPGSGITLTPVNGRESRLDLSIILPLEVAGQVIAIVGGYAR